MNLVGRTASGLLNRWLGREEVAAAIKGLKIGVVSEMMKAAGGFGSRWMTDLINNIVKEDCIPDDCRKSILVPVYKGIHLYVGHTDLLSY